MCHFYYTVCSSVGRTHIYFFDSYAKFAHFISQHFLFLGLIMALREIRGLVSLFHPVHYHCNINLSGMDFILSGCISWQCKSIKNALWFSKGTLAPNISKGWSKALVLNKFNRRWHQREGHNMNMPLFFHWRILFPLPPQKNKMK